MYKIHDETIHNDIDLVISLKDPSGLIFCHVYDTPNEDIGWSHDEARRRANRIVEALNRIAT